MSRTHARARALYLSARTPAGCPHIATVIIDDSTAPGEDARAIALCRRDCARHGTLTATAGYRTLALPHASLKGADMPTGPGEPAALERLASWDSVLGPSKTDVNARPKTVAELEKERAWWAQESDDSDETEETEETGESDETGETGDEAAGESAQVGRALELQPEPEPEPQPQPFAEPTDEDDALVSKMAQLREEFTRGVLKEADFVAAHLQLAGDVATPEGEAGRGRGADHDRQRELLAAEALATVEGMRALERAQTAEAVTAILAVAPPSVLLHALPRHEAWEHSLCGSQRLLHHAAACGCPLEVLSAVLAACPAAASVAGPAPFAQPRRGNGVLPSAQRRSSTPAVPSFRGAPFLARARNPFRNSR